MNFWVLLSCAITVNLVTLYITAINLSLSLSLIMNEVDSVEGWVVAKDSMEAVLWMAWTIIQAEGIWKEISTKGEVQDIILNNIKVQREKQLAEMVMKRRKERALKLTEAAKRG